jgi:DNA topoisomerase-1
MNLMIIESPGKVEKLTAILGTGWKVVACYGHIRDLPKDGMGVSAPEFVPQYEYIPARPGRGGRTFPGSKERVQKIAALVKEASAVYLATDPDREGESISWHLQECLKLKNPIRVTFNAIKAETVREGLATPRRIDRQRVAAQEARRTLDRLVGYMVSPKLRDQTGQALSAGLVQSVAVRLVVDRERQIANFKPTTHFGAKLVFEGSKSEWTALWLTKPDFVSDESPYFMGAAFAQRVSECSAVTVDSFEHREARRCPPGAFTTSTLQQAASVKLGMNPKTAMEVAQRLFDKGHITYHRTDNPNIDEADYSDIGRVARSLGLTLNDKLRRFKVPDTAEAGHPATTPTHWDVESAGENDDERALYRLIRQRALACQLEDALYAVRTVRLSADEEVDGRVVAFEAQGRTLTRKGWLALTGGDDTEEKAEAKPEDANPVPAFERGRKLTPVRGELVEQKTRAPKRYSEASLVAKLEAEGIGRPSTYAAVMDNIVSRTYVAVKAGYLTPTPSGELIVDSLVNRFAFLELGYTREIETEFDRIANGQAAYKSVVSSVHAQLVRELGCMSGSFAPQHPCPSCGKGLRRIKGKSGFFWGCSGYPTCSTSLPDVKGVPGEQKPVPKAQAPCPACGKALAHRFKPGKGGYDFWSCVGYRDGCKQTYPNADNKPAIPTSPTSSHGGARPASHI